MNGRRGCYQPKRAVHVVSTSKKFTGGDIPTTAQLKKAVAQPTTAGSAQTRRMPSAPPVYRPQPMPKVLQTKMPATHQSLSHTGRARSASEALRLYSPQSAPVVLQTKTPIATPITVEPQLAHSPAAPSIYRPQHASAIVQPESVASPREAMIKQRTGNGPIAARCIVQRAPAKAFRSAVVQATKYYPNLHPGAAVPVDRSNIFSLDSFADQYRLHRVDSHGVNVPNMKYNFVRTREGSMLMHNRYRHPSLADGQQVLYAGEIFFNNGKLEWWSNGSGHYQPDQDGAEQANLPMDSFFSYQQIIKGEHTRKRG
jgi:hypothetical protein